MSPKPQPAQAARAQAQRTPNDVAALGVELLRAVREHEFRSRRGGGAAAASVDRAFRAWQADLERHGDLDLVLDERGVRAADAATPAGRGRLDELAHRLRERRVVGVRTTPELDAPTWRALVSLLAAEPEEVLRHGDAAGFLPEGCTGLELRTGEEGSGDEAEKPPAETRASAVAAQATATTMRAEATTTTTRTGAEAATTMTRTGAEAATTTTPTGAEAAAPEAANPDAWAARLDACADDDAYAATVREAVRAAAEASDAGDAETCHAVMGLLSGQAEARGRRGAPTPERCALARDGLRELATGRRLSELLARAGGDQREDGLQAGRILVQLAEEAAPALISAIDAQEGERREQLLGLAVALGRAATPALRRAMEGSSARRARIAARLAGEVQDARAVPTLARLLEHDDAEVRSEAARALARVGDERALDALEAGLESPHEDVSSICAWCLGATGRAEAARALTGALQRARRARRLHLAGAVIRSLGRLGREDPVPELRRILARRSLFRRRELRDLKLQALDALAKLPGEEAREALEEVAAGADMSLAVAARRAAKQRTEDGEKA